MAKEQREVYERRAKEDKIASKSNPGTHEKYTSQGIPFSVIDRQKAEAEKKEKNMKSRVKNLIDDAFMTNGESRQALIFRVVSLISNYNFVFLLLISYFRPAVLFHDG